MKLLTLFNIIFVFPALISCYPKKLDQEDDNDDDDDNNPLKISSSFDVGALFNSTSPLGQALGPLGGALSAFLGQTGNPTVQNELKSAVKGMGGNGTGDCPAMSIIFARGTAEPGLFSSPLELSGSGERRRMGMEETKSVC
jgi:hypothetical protein